METGKSVYIRFLPASDSETLPESKKEDEPVTRIFNSGISFPFP
jgi:hypothetical protein